MKGIILSGGYGTRLRPITYSQQKQLIPVANKPILFYAIEDVINSGIKDIGIIIGPNKDQVINTVNSVEWDANITFIYQGAPKGLAHAVLVSEEFIDDDNFVMYLGDNLIKEGIVKHTKKFIKHSPESLILLTEVAEPQRFGVVKLKNGKVIRLIEKPKKPPSNLALVGIYFFKPIIIDACKSIKPSWRNELEITDAIQWLIDKGYTVEATIVSGWWKDTGKPEDILDANRLILDDIKRTITGKIIDSEIIGRVIIENDNAIIKNSVIKGPCIIGKNTIIESSYIGPYTSIGPNCRISNTEIEDSIVMEGSTIENAGRIIESLIGKGVKISENTKIPRGHKFVVGDNSNIVL